MQTYPFFIQPDQQWEKEAICSHHHNIALVFQEYCTVKVDAEYKHERVCLNCPDQLEDNH